MTRAIGIDLGTTYTVVATITNGRASIIPDSEGQYLTPSVVAFPSGRRPLVGQPAKRQATLHPHRTVFSIKRRMGSDHRLSVADQAYTPPEISSLILRKVKTDAEHYLGEKLAQVVITVPAYFNDRQRQATREAGALAGLDVMRIINEPTAAALAYGVQREDVHTVLVWDLGGGTFDVSILDVGEGIFEVRAVSGDAWLGGDDFDARIMDHLTREYRRAYRDEFPTEGRLRQRLREAAEEAKIQLSSSAAVQVCVPVPRSKGPSALVVDLTREHLNDLTADLLQRMATATKQALADSGLGPEDIDRVILVGGATRMPAVRDLARKILGKEPYRYIDPDTVVGAGAAIQAGVLLGIVERVALLDVLPLSLGVETQGGLTTKIIPRNTRLPASEARIFTTAADYQTSMDLHILQGERALAADNVSLGQLQLQDIPSAPKGVPKVEVAFDADVDGILHVSATELASDSQVRVQLTSTKNLDSLEIDQLAEEARKRTEQDGQTRDRIEAGIEAENLITAAEMTLDELAGVGAASQSQEIVGALARLKEALDRDSSGSMRIHSRELRELLSSKLPDRPRAAGSATPR